jgi:heptosyltransferase-2
MKTLIRLPNWIGDAVMATPAIRQIIAHSESTAVWGPSKTASLFHGFPKVERVLELDEKEEPERLDEIRAEQFSRVFLLTNSYSTAKAARDLGIPERIGYHRSWRGFLLTRPLYCGWRVRHLHMVDYYLHLLPKEWRAEPVDRQPCLHLTLEEEDRRQQALENLAGPLASRVVGIAPGAAFGSAKQWEQEWYQQVARWMMEMGFFVMVFGTEKDCELGDFILQGTAQAQGRNLAGQTSLRELMASIASCRCLLTNDSGPMHLADAVGTPAVALFGSTDSGWTGPRSRNHHVLQSKVPCSPCFLRECPLDRECMKELSVNAVIQSLEEILEIPPCPG